MISMKSQKGFTLIELLIVIVIIGILAGVLIAIIDPQAQQDRAKDANVTAGLNKIALAIGGYKAAYGDVPTANNVPGLLSNGTALSGQCASGGYTCLFSISLLPLWAPGNVAGSGCSTTAGEQYRGDGSGVPQQSGQCYFRYVGDNTAGVKSFKIWAKSFAISDSTLKYDSTTGKIHKCPYGTSDCTT